MIVLTFIICIEKTSNESTLKQCTSRVQQFIISNAEELDIWY